MATLLQIDFYGPERHAQNIIVQCNKCKSVNFHGVGDNTHIIRCDDGTIYKSIDFRNLGRRMCDNMDCDANYYLYSNNK
jgi:hypothetical protein